MKKIFLLFVFVFTTFLSFDSHAQGGAYNEGDKIFMAGVGFGTFIYGGLPISASLEFGVHPSLSVGGFAGYSGGQYWNQFALGAKGSWHFLPLVNRELEANIDDDKWDLYVSAYLGYRMFSYGLDRSLYPGVRSNYGGALFSGALGAKYFFSRNFAGYFELGGPMSYTNLGISLTF